MIIIKTVIWKAYMDFEKEEKWLNEMSAIGYALTDYTWCRYVFNKCAPGEYIYRLELLKSRPSQPEGRAYIEFLEETGVEHISSYRRWVYLRKRSTDGGFDIYSDMESKIGHYRRLFHLFIISALANFIPMVLNFSLWYGIARPYSSVNLFAGFFSMIILCMLAKLSINYHFKIRWLNKEKLMRE